MCPTLWRAANIGDLDVLERTAADLSQRAAAAGAPRVAALCQELAAAAADGPDAYLAMLRPGASGLLVQGGSAERLVEMIHRAHERSA